MKDALFGIFGNYFILDRIATGGMAEIFLARPAITAANGRILILKRILPQVTLDPEFINMFESEIQVSMGFNHPNLVQIYDFGKVEGKHFIAMEYIEGKNLREITSKYSASEQSVPIEIAVSVAAQTAAGLQYAHHYKNHVTGEALNIVHRDISPQNILVSYEGNVKIIDFGIAKSESTNADKTRAGCIKGKVSYLSPEQLFQKDLDGRSDVFSLGAVLWELLAGHKLFHQSGQSDLEIMETIAHCDGAIFPPSLYNSKVSPKLDTIVMKALAKDRHERYENAEEFQRTLHDFLQEEIPKFTIKKVSEAMKEVFKTELEEERKQIRALNLEAQTLLQGGEVTTQLETSLPQVLGPPQRVAFGSRSYTTPSSVSMSPPELKESSYGPTPLLPKKVREQLYIKLTFGRALSLLFYAGTLLVLRLDQDQIFLNMVFGARSSQASQMEKQIKGEEKGTIAQRKTKSSHPAAVVLEKNNSALGSNGTEMTNAKSEESDAKKLDEREVLPKLSIDQKQHLKKSLRSIAHSQTLVGRNPATKNSKLALVRIKLILKSGPRVTAIRVNQQKIDLNQPVAQVPLDQKFWVRVDRKNGRPFLKSYQLKPEVLRSTSSYDLTLVLY